MAFLETPIFPGRVLMGASRTIQHSVETVRQVNRRAVKNINTSQGWRSYSFIMPTINSTEFDELQAHYLAVKGTAHQFRLEDWVDHDVVQSDGYLGQSINGTGLPTYQLHKRYVSGALIEWRAIRKPKATGNTIYRNAAPATAGASPGNYALSSTTGIVTWVADAQSSVSSHTVGASHQVTLSVPLAGLAIGGKIYLTGVAGTAANTLNSLAHPVTNIVGSVVTIGVNTTGLGATGGTGFKYPQPTDTLNWAGSFDTPVSYETELQFQTQAQNVYVAQQVLLMEEYV